MRALLWNLYYKLATHRGGKGSKSNRLASLE
jgi:hypothetical protein